MSVGAFRAGLLGVLLMGALARAGYVHAIPRYDPAWNDPGLDGSYYLQWGRAIAGHGEAPDGAYYLAPFYPYMLGTVFLVLGDRILAVYLIQQAVLLGSALLLGGLAKRAAGPGAALAATGLVLAYHPALFFAAKPVGETVAILLLVGALVLVDRPGSASPVVGGALASLGALGRPNFLLVPMLWAGWAAISGELRRALYLAAAIAVVLFPVALRNLSASRHLVPISSNGGITLFHGNGPGATGGFTLPRGFTGRIETQRDEATALASLSAGKSLDPVQADGWWGVQAVRTRLADIPGTLRLLGWRFLLLVDNAEHGLDYAPALDPNPWRRSAPVSFAMLFGLAAFGLAMGGFRGTGGAHLWTALAACAATPVFFYAASRYRLPVAVLLCVPAGRGVVEVVRALEGRVLGRRGMLGILGGAAAVAVSLLVPSGELVRAAEGGALANRSAIHARAGDLDGAERDARLAIDLDPSGLAGRFQLGVVVEKMGRLAEAETAYRELLAREPGHAPAAANLARLLVGRSDPGAAVPFLERALVSSPVDSNCWNNLVVALALSGKPDEAVTMWHEARRRGVALDDGLLEAIEGGAAASGTEKEDGKR